MNIDALIGRIGNSAAPVMTAAYIAAIGHPFPTTSFVLAVVIGLGRASLCMLNPRADFKRMCQELPTSDGNNPSESFRNF